MKCPSCNTRLMPANRGPVAIDFCPKCWGVWLDRGELDAIIRESRSPEHAQGVASRPILDPGNHLVSSRPH
ncbi:TFIIB-type zinc ribbon-containing protein [Tautonia rosea]|uniref:TFIIB-type zinc ribbon-containing protein n=1 Tax=Tautonia rosea TaxID=2728037 RepID=UPI001474353B